MKHESLFPIHDEARTAWLFLLLDVNREDRTLNTCAVGVGHSDRLLEREVFDGSDGGSPLIQLCDFLSSYQYQDVTLITTSNTTLPELRSCLFESGKIGQPTLRGFTHISIESLITQYFDTGITSVTSITELPPTEEGVHEAWERVSELVPLVPVVYLKEEPL